MVPAIKSVDTSKVANLDERTFQRSKSVIEKALSASLANKDDIGSDGSSPYLACPMRFADARQRQTPWLAHHSRGLGYADAAGDEARTSI